MNDQIKLTCMDSDFLKFDDMVSFNINESFKIGATFVKTSTLCQNNGIKAWVSRYNKNLIVFLVRYPV